MMDNARRLAFLILRDVEGHGAFSNIALNSCLEKNPVDNPGFVRRLVHGVLKNRMLLDYRIDSYLRKPGIKIGDRVLLQLGFYQLMLADDIPNHAAINETVEIAAKIMKGHQGFINGVLRAYSRDGCPGMLEIPALAGIATGAEPILKEVDIKALSVNYSTPRWIIELWLKAYGFERTLDMLRVNLTEPPLTKRVSLLNPALESVQDEASMEAIKVFDPKPGDKVLDMCAAPGGKSCAMAELMGNSGSITACDIYENRLKLIEKEKKRLGIDIIKTEIRDASIVPGEEFADCYDAVLCDVPCSGLGVLRRKPEIKYNAAEKDVKTLPNLQLRILKNGAYQVKPGGKLMYSTCTLNPAENEEVIKRFMEDSGFAVEAEKQLFPKENGCDGFFYCLMRRRND